MSKYHLLFAILLCLFSACSRTPSPETLAGEWHQDSDYFQSIGIFNQLHEIDIFENYELYFTDERLAAACIVGKEPNRKLVVWNSPFSLSTDSSGIHYITFNSHEGKPISAAVSFKNERLIVKINKRIMGFLPGGATNLRIKGEVPKS
jgi:hypothetical protein